MRKSFTYKFAARMILEVGIVGVAANVLLQMQFQNIEVDREESQLAQFFVLPLLAAAAIAGFALLAAVHNTNVLRRYEFSLKPGRERVFYFFFAAILTAAAAADAFFLLQKCLPLLEHALNYALKDAEIKNETESFRRQAVAELNERAAGYKTAAYISAALFTAVQAAAYFFGAAKLVKVYRDPPDYWSGKKKGKRR